MISTGKTPKATSDATPQITLLPAVPQERFDQLTVMTDGTPCFVSPDGGSTWAYMPSGCRARTFEVGLFNQAVLLERATTANVTGIFADAQ